MSLIAGIDLGTTNSLIAVSDGSAPRVLPVDGNPILPSVVGYAQEQGIVVGFPAKNQYVLRPEATVRSIKRHMGEESYRVSLGGRAYAPEDISAIILERLAAAASQELGESVRQVVITVPAFFADAQRRATLEAGRRAGLEVVRLLNEPTAAALAYGFGQDRSGINLVYDLGGGTFDVSVVDLQDSITEVRASHGNRKLGGDDFDARIVNWLRESFQKQHGIDLSHDLRAMARLAAAAEAAKIRLSSDPYVQIREEFLATQGKKPLHLDMELSRSEFEDMIRDLLEGTLTSVRQTLEDSKLQKGDIETILLVGGSTRIPAVQELIADYLGVAPQVGIDPDKVVALGAAVQGAISAGLNPEAILVDVAPYSLGVRVSKDLWDDDLFSVLIRRNTAIPTTHSRVFYTMFPDQENVRVRAYQGESQKASENTFLGEFLFEKLSPGREGKSREVQVTFDYDLSGVLHVSATDRKSGRKEEIRIDTQTRSTALPPELQSLRSRLEALQAEGGEQSNFAEKAAALLGELDPSVDPEALDQWAEKASDLLYDYDNETAY